MKKTRPVLAKCVEVSKETKARICREIANVVTTRIPSSWLDTSQAVSYTISFSEKSLVISVAEASVQPNASMLPFLTEKFGPPSNLYANRSKIKPELIILYMTWENFNESVVSKGNVDNAFRY
ncbi:hypothetical protein J2T17_007685 [Paenibacillus mucilaginosus]|uniref:hypothetical protein n=1 Tax=Paenibacillus mucilaginosus TaxID=61624 RepID=UPI003D1E43CD